MYTVWLVDKYKIAFKLVINRWTNEILVTELWPCCPPIYCAHWTVTQTLNCGPVAPQFTVPTGQ